MFFTEVGLEQSTDEWIAKYKAQSISGDMRIADLCCGIGGDLLALAGHGHVTGFDRDVICSIVAAANVSVCHDSPSQCVPAYDFDVRCEDIARLCIDEFDAWHIDPDRRPSNRRTTNVDDQEPGWNVIESLLNRNPNALIKLAPATNLPPSIAASSECEWIGNRRECKQLLVRCGTLARYPGLRTATIVNGDRHNSLVSQGNAPIAHQDQVGQYLYESHPSLLAAGIVQDLAAGFDLKSFTLVRPGGGAAWGYLTSDQIVESAGFTGFRVEVSMPFDRKKLLTVAAENNWTIDEVKKRGVRELPKQVLSWFPTHAGARDNKMTLIIAPTIRGVRAMFAHRL